MEDYIPDKDGDLLTWLANLSKNLPTYASALSLSDETVKSVQNAASDIDVSVKKNTEAQAAARQATAEKVKSVHTNLGIIRVAVAQAKKSTGFTTAIGEALGVMGSDNPVNPDTYKPKISADVFPGHVTLKFTKKGVQGVNIYSQLKGEAKWEKLSFDSYSPYVDNRLLHVPGTAEVRQYMAMGVVHDQEIGQMSDIIEVTIGG